MIKNFSEKKQKFLEGISVKQIIMVTGSVLLLVVFLAPNAVSQCSRLTASSGTIYATTKDGKSLTLGQLDDVRKQLHVLANVRVLAQRAIQMGGAAAVNGLPVLAWLATTDLKDPGHWWLISNEARDAGLVGGTGDGQTMLARIATRWGGSPEQLLGGLAADSHASQKLVLTTMAELAGVERLMSLVHEAPRAGSSRQKFTARELLTTVSCDVVPIRGDAVGSVIDVKDPDLTELEAQFKLGRDFAEGAGPNGVGYKLPDRVRVEWFILPRVEIAKTVANDPALGDVELRKEFLKDKMAYVAPNADGTKPTEPPTFEAVKDRVADAVRQRLVNERAEKIAAFVREQNRASLKDFPTSGGIVTLPKDWKDKMPSLVVLAQDLTNKFGLHNPPAISGSGADLLPVQRADKELFIGPLTTTELGQPMTGAMLISRVHELNPDARLPLQVGVVGPVLFTTGKDMAVYRVTEAVPAAAPAAMGDVQASVLRDVLASLRFAELERKAPEILAEAEKSGLPALASKYSTVVDAVPQLSMGSAQMMMMGQTAMPSALSAAGRDVDAVRTVIERALTFPAGTPVAQLPESQRMMTVPVPTKRLLLVVKINDVKPPALEDWTTLSSMGAITNSMTRTEKRADLAAMFSDEQLRQRHGYTLANPEGPDRHVPPPPPMF